MRFPIGPSNAPRTDGATQDAIRAIAELLLDGAALAPDGLGLGGLFELAKTTHPELRREVALWGAAVRGLVHTGAVAARFASTTGWYSTSNPDTDPTDLVLLRSADWAWERALRLFAADPRTPLIAHVVGKPCPVVDQRMPPADPDGPRRSLLGALVAAVWAGEVDLLARLRQRRGIEPESDDATLLALLRFVPAEKRSWLISLLFLDVLQYPWFGEFAGLQRLWPEVSGPGAVDALLVARVFAGDRAAGPRGALTGAAVWAALLHEGVEAAAAEAAAVAQVHGVRPGSATGLPSAAVLPCVVALGLSSEHRHRALAHRIAEDRSILRGRKLEQTPDGAGALRTDQGHPRGKVPPLGNLPRAREGEPLAPLSPPSDDLLCELVLGLAQRFGGLEPDVERLQAAAVAADDLELPRLAAELRALAGDEEGGRGATLHTRWLAPPRWEAVLGRIAAQLGVAPDQAARGRVRWTLDLAALEAGTIGQTAARLQVPDKTGRITSGRIVKPEALQRGAVREATQQDAAVAALLCEPRYGPRHDRLSLALRVVTALAGHPFVSDALGRPLIVRARKSELRLRRVPGGVRLEAEQLPQGKGVHIPTPGVVEAILTDAPTQDLLGQLGAGITIPDEGRAALLDLLPSLRERVAVDDRAGLTEGEPVAEPQAGQPHPVLQLRPAGGGAAVRACVRPAGALGPAVAAGAGPEELVLRVDGVLQTIVRDLPEELRRLDELRALIPALDGLEPGQERDLPDPWAALELLEAVAAAGHRAAVEWPEGKPLRIRARVGLRELRLRWQAGTGDWLSAEGGLSLPTGENIDLESLLAALRSGSRGFVPLGEGAFLALSAELKQQLERLDRARRVGAAAEGVQVHALAMGALRGLLENSELGPEANARLARLQAAAEALIDLPDALAARLRPYQLDGLRWMARLCTLGVGALLADDMGLGKTLQSLALLSARAGAGPALVLAPASVVGGWVDQAAAFTPWLKVHRLDDLAKGALKVGPGEVVACSYGLLPHHGERLAGVSWSTLVIDEAQAIKNADTQRHQLVTKLRAEARLALSGTPVENHLTELWSLSEVLNPGLLGPADAFRRRFAEPIAEGDDEARDQLRGLLLPLVLRRSKTEVLPDLPPRIDITVPVQLSPEESIAYERLRLAAVDEIAAQGADPMRVLVALTRLRQAACHPSLVDPGLAGLPSAKLEALGELLDHLVENDHRALIFSQFTAHLDRAQALVEARGVGWHRLDGGVPARERDRRVKAFQAGEGRVFLISLRAGGAGLNLTGADHVVHLDPWWNPAVEDQASDRAHRIGQTKPVTIYRLIAQGTIEDKILRMHAEKRAMADQLLAGADGAANLGVSELVALISEGSLAAPVPKRRKR